VDEGAFFVSTLGRLIFSEVQGMREQLAALKAEALAAIAAAADTSGIQELRVKYLGKKGALTAVLSGLGKLPAEERPVMGALANEIKNEVAGALAAREAELAERELAARLEAERIDISLPGTPAPRGYLHLMRQMQTRIEDLFIAMGWDVAAGREVDTDWYNFGALNFPDDHPSRDAQDSFFIKPADEQRAKEILAGTVRKDDVLLRTHTSNTQIHYMLEVAKGRTPVRVVCPGRTFRRDFEDATHGMQFHQVEGLVVDKGITLGDLKGTLLEMARGLFGPQTKVRLRPSFFPFTEPSAEMDVSCPFCAQKGCRVCKHSGWIEIGGSGMVHPNVLKNGGYDPEEVSGFAFGYGIERVTMLAYQIEDLRHFVNNDLRFNRQF
jgi:phenylalanyl-tRNA synthetase alpha chain